MHISEDVIRRVLKSVVADMEPVQRKRVIEVLNGGQGASFEGLQSKEIPLCFSIDGVKYDLPESLADNESIPEGMRRSYNKALVRFGQTDMLLPEHTIHKLVRAHEWLWIKAGKPDGKPVKVRKAPEPRPDVPRNFVWKGQPCTKAQFEQRVRMTKGEIPSNCLMPANAGLAVDVSARFDVVVQDVEPKAKAKKAKPVVMDDALGEAMRVLGLDPKILAALNG